MLNGGFVAQSTAHFDLELAQSGYRGYRPGIDRPAELGAVEVDDVQPLRTVGAELAGLFDGIVVLVYLAIVLALDESDTLAVPQVNCRYYVHLRILKSFFNDIPAIAGKSKSFDKMRR